MLIRGEGTDWPWQIDNLIRMNRMRRANWNSKLTSSWQARSARIAALEVPG
jgi:hypothetical protein